MPSTAISPEPRHLVHQRRFSSIVAVLVAAGLAGAPAGPALAAAWPAELGPVLSWTPPVGAANPGQCTQVVDRGRNPGASIQAAVDAAGPGDMVCVRSTNHRDEVVEIRRSGAPGRPIEVHALADVVSGGFVVDANDVIIRGFTIETGRAADAEDWRAGFELRGRRLGIIDNTITDPAGYGIHCSLGAPHCTDTAIIGNTIRGADGNGINAIGYDLLVEGNEVSGSIRRYANDADGIRFFGERLLLRDNFIHRIFDRGYATEGPHTDCFQNFDSGRPSTRDVVIEDNVCFDVDHQCLIAETPVRREGAGLVFRRNICANNGSQGVMAREFDGLLVEENIFLSTIYYNAVVLRQEVTNATIRCNLVVGRPALHEIDQSSRQGLRITGNQRAESPAAAPAARAALASGGCNLPPLSPWLERSVLLPDDTRVDAGRELRP
jgi:hypothetical protein